MTFRDEVRKILDGLTDTPVAIPCDNPSRMQVTICQLGQKKYGTLNCNGVIYAWRRT